MKIQSLGMIEVLGFLSAVEALDVSLKSSNVSLVNCTKISGGLVTIIVTGDVGAVEAAINAATTAIEQKGTLISSHIIARPSDEVVCLLDGSPNAQTENVTITETITETVAEIVTEEVVSNVTENTPKATAKVESSVSDDDLDNMSVPELRNVARQLKLNNITKNEIKFAKKAMLINKIREFKGSK